MSAQHIAGPYWVRTTTNGKHQVCGRNGATICEYRADQVAMADAHCRKLQAGHTNTEKALRDAAPDMLDGLSGLMRVLLPIEMSLAQAEMAGEPTPDNAVLFSFMGSGASDHVTVGEYRKAVDAALAAISRATPTAEGVA